MSEVDLTQLAIDRSGTAVPEHRRRRWLTRFLLPTLLLASFAGLVGWFSRDLVFPPKPVTVIPVHASRAALQRTGSPLFQAAGWIEPRPTMVRVAALAPGVVERLLVVEDQAVQAGEPVAELVRKDAELAYRRAQADSRLQQAQLEQAEAVLTAAETRLQQPVHLHATLGQASAALAEVDTELANLPYALRRAQAELDFARKNYEGKTSAGAAISGRTLDAAKSQVEMASALVEELSGRADSLKRQREALLQRRDALQTQLDLLADEIRARDEARAKVKAAEAQLELAHVRVAEAKLQLDRMTIRAPIAGRIYQLIGHPGTRLSGATSGDRHDSSTVVTMYCPDMLQVRVDVRFEDIPDITLGQEVRLNNPALAEPISGSVLFIGSEADIQKNTLEVKVAIPSPPAVLKPEMLVDVTFIAPQQEGAPELDTGSFRIYLPDQLVHREDGEPFVWVADQSRQQAWKTPVALGEPGTGELVEITEGLTISSRIIADNHGQLRHGQRIRVMGEDTTIGVDVRGPSGRDAKEEVP